MTDLAGPTAFVDPVLPTWLDDAIMCYFEDLHEMYAEIRYEEDMFALDGDIEGLAWIQDMSVRVEQRELMLSACHIAAGFS